MGLGDNYKARVTITQTEGDVYEVEFEGITGIASLLPLLRAAKRQLRRKLSFGISASEDFPLAKASAINGSPAETGA